MVKDDGGPAFPIFHAQFRGAITPGMSLRDWFAGQALSNPAICNGDVDDQQIGKWFGQRHVTEFEIHRRTSMGIR